jgi:hypothetical protein
MPTNLLLLPVLGGFCFVHFCYFLNFRAQRLDGYRLLLESALWGLLLTLPARLITYYWPRYSSTGWRIREEWGHLFRDAPLSGTASVSLLLGLSLPFLINWLHATYLQLPEQAGEREKDPGWFYDERNPKRKIEEFLKPAKIAARDRSLKDLGNDLQRLLYKAIQQDDPILVTLANRRVYVGYVTETPSLLNPESQYLSLLPALSGYRDNETLQVVLDLIYPDPEELKGKVEFDPEDLLLMTVPLSEIKSASLYHQDLQGLFLSYPHSASDPPPAEILPEGF